MARKHPDTSPEDTSKLSVEHATEANVTPASEQATSAVIETEVKSERVETGEGPSFIAQVLPAIGGSISKAVYGTFYYASYGVVFSALTVARLTPMNNVMGRAIKDGAADAKQAVEKSEAASSAQESVPTDDAALTA